VHLEAINKMVEDVITVIAHLSQGKISMVWELRLKRSLWDVLSENR
jgi:hypothetical protein